MDNQYNKNKIDGLLRWAKFEQGLQFYVPIGAICPDTKEKQEGELALVVVVLQ